MNVPNRLRFVNVLVGSFILVILLFLFVLLFYKLLISSEIKNSVDYHLFVTQEQLGSLAQDADVVILGKSVGQVGDIAFDDEKQKVKVTLRIKKDEQQKIFRDSEVLQQRRLTVGEPIIVIRRPEKPGQELEPLPPGSELTNYVEMSDPIDDVVGEVAEVSKRFAAIQEDLRDGLEELSNSSARFRGTLDQTADPALTETEKAAKSFLKTNEELRPKADTTLQSVTNATKSLEKKIGDLTDKVDKLVDQNIRTTLNNIDKTTGNIDQAAASIEKTSETTGEDVAKTLETIKEAAERVNQLAVDTQDLVRVLRGEANDLPGTTQRVNETVQDTQDLVGEVRSHWLLRRYSQKGKPSKQLAPSTIRGGSVR